jgi:hypothetical protein
MQEITCAVPDCSKPRYQKRIWCGSHTMRAYRYGDPLARPEPRFIDLTGQRYGLLTVLERVNGRWLCACNCGDTTVVRVGDLNRGTAGSCGARKHRERRNAGYGAAHARVKRDRGATRGHQCIDCGAQAAQWSYDHTCPDELTDGATGAAYSLNVSRYDPRCVSCHKQYDLSRIARGAADREQGHAYPLARRADD